MDSQKTYTVMTGAEFNRSMANTKLYKLLNGNLKHYDYTYEPNALNGLDKTGEVFNPDPNCKPGGLYFTMESMILKFTSCVMWSPVAPLIVRVEIPDDGQISIGTHKCKTDKLILGQPIPFDEFFSDEYISTMDVDELDVDDWRCTPVWTIIKKQYMLNPLKNDSNEVLCRKRNQMIHAIRVADIEFLDLMLGNRDIQKIMAQRSHVSFLVVLFGYETKLDSSVIEWFSTHFPKHELIDVLNNRSRESMLQSWYSN